MSLEMVIIRKQRRGVDIPESEKRMALNAFRSSFNSDIDTLAENLYDGRITLGMWEEDMRTRLREYLYGSAAIGKGGFDKLTRSDKGWIGAELKKQYGWLHRFARDIYDRRATISMEAIKVRAHLYANAGAKVATHMQAGEELADRLPWIPGDGSTRCLNSCGCEWVLTLDVVGVGGSTTRIVEATWVLHPEKEHCEDCIPREGHKEVITVSADAVVPASIGLGG